MPTRAEATRQKMVGAIGTHRAQVAEKEQKKSEALLELRTTGVTEWAEFAVGQIHIAVDEVAEQERRSGKEVLLPCGGYGYYDVLRGKYYSILNQSDIESIIPDVHEQILLRLKADGYVVTDPLEKEFPYEYDGVQMVSRRKVVTVSW